ncbi:hypothetical protein GCM10010517_46400 [Streptosporangium fragile]|uniref:DNA-directed RNA polymerase specialized sigma subunit, sigma24 family n=1 Tax=Streptosporangium fragile TaxID=46186 RepID=A0ABP6IK11_9ACTN
MTQQLLGQRSRGELIAELYDRHAAGLFAYCHDQLGDAGSAAEVLAAVLSGVSDAEPPRAALYALARREIYLRDIVYSPPRTDLDPATAFVDRVLRELRPHQREVLYLSGVRELNTAELSWVLDVASDTADELTVSACRRFARALTTALASARIPGHLTEVFGALTVAPVRDVLNLAPWAVPPASLRAALLGPQAPAAPVVTPRSPSPLVKQLWPTTPAWPVPLADAGPATGLPAGTSGDLPAAPVNGLPAGAAFTAPDPVTEDRFPDPFAPPDPDEVSAHEASTEPMPKLRGPVLSALDEAAVRPRRRRLQRPRPRGAAPMPAPIPGDVLDDAPPRDDLFRPLTPEARAARARTDRLVAAAPRGETDSPVATPGTPVVPATPEQALGTPRQVLGTPEQVPDAPEAREPVTEAREPVTEARETPARVWTPEPPEPVPAPEVPQRAWVPGVPAHGDAPLLGDVLDDPAPARPLPGWPLQIDQIDALAEREREHERTHRRERGHGHEQGHGYGHDPLRLPGWVAQRDLSPAADLQGTVPSSSQAPRDTTPPAPPPTTRTSRDATPPAPPPTGTTPPAPSPTAQAPADGPRSQAGRSPLRLPSWIMRDDLTDETPEPGPAPHLAWDGTAAARLFGSGTATGLESGFGGATGRDSGGAAAEEPGAIRGAGTFEKAETAGTAVSRSARATSPRRTGRRGRHKHKAPAKARHHHDWAWELIGFLIAVTIAMIVFFAVPMIATP